MVKYGSILIFLIGLLIITIYFIPLAINAVKGSKKENREDSSSFFKVYSPELLFFIGPFALLSLIIMSSHIRSYSIHLLYYSIITLVYSFVSIYLLRSNLKSRRALQSSYWTLDTVLSLFFVFILIIISICTFSFYFLKLNTVGPTSIINTY